MNRYKSIIVLGILAALIALISASIAYRLGKIDERRYWKKIIHDRDSIEVQEEYERFKKIEPSQVI